MMGIGFGATQGSRLLPYRGGSTDQLGVCLLGAPRCAPVVLLWATVLWQRSYSPGSVNNATRTSLHLQSAIAVQQWEPAMQTCFDWQAVA